MSDLIERLEEDPPVQDGDECDFPDKACIAIDILHEKCLEAATALRDYDRLCVKAIPAHKTELIEELNRIRGSDEY